MDLLQTLLVSRQGELRPAYTTMDPATLGDMASRTNMAAYSSSPSQLLSSQGLSLSQGIPDASRSAPALERPPSCGQPYGDENVIPDQTQSAALSGPTFEPHNDNIDDDRDDFSDSVSPKLIPMEEWEKQNPAAPYVPKRKVIPATVPRSTGEWTAKFQHRCDQYGVRPDFAYDESPMYHFNATLTVSGRTFQTQKPQPSKKHAKEEVCKLALAEIPPLEKEQEVQMRGAGKKGKKRKSEDAGLEPLDVKKSDRSEEWIGLLNSRFQRNDLGALQWEDSKVQGARQGFICSLPLPQRSDQPFTTSPDTVYATKQDARTAVARDAVLWLRSQGMLSETATMKRQTSAANPTVNGQAEATASSHREQLSNLVQELGLKSQPRFILTPCPPPPGQQVPAGGTEARAYCDVHCVFDERDAEAEELLRGKLGEVTGCLGKAKAKEACSECVIPILEEVKRKRLAAF